MDLHREDMIVYCLVSAAGMENSCLTMLCVMLGEVL